METWKILIISLAAAVVLGLAVGIATGKYMVNRAKSNRKPLLSKKERIVYCACILLGTASILFGVFFPFPSSGGMGMNNDGMTVIGGDMPAGDAGMKGEANPVAGEEIIIAGETADVAEDAAEPAGVNTDEPVDAGNIDEPVDEEMEAPVETEEAEPAAAVRTAGAVGVIGGAVAAASSAG